jgi:hypothetical protein
VWKNVARVHGFDALLQAITEVDEADEGSKYCENDHDHEEIKHTAPPSASVYPALNTTLQQKTPSDHSLSI